MTRSTRSFHRALCFAGAVLFAVTAARAADTVVIDTNTTFQTIRSWGAPSGARSANDRIRPSILDELVFSLGLTRSRMEPSRREREDPLNDDGDPFHLNPAAFDMSGTDKAITDFYLPLKQRVESLGEHFEFYVSPSFFNGGSTGGVPAWLINSPGEYAEWVVQFLQYIRDRHNLRADFYCICNEGGNNNNFTTPIVAMHIKSLGPRLESLGLRTRLEFPESVSANNAWAAIQSVQGDAELWRWVGLVSYHLYGSNNDRTNIQNFALTQNLPTAQSEFIGLSVDWLHDDLTQGGVSTWEWYAINDFLPYNTNSTWFSRNVNFWRTRQVIKYVRPGAVRVAATSSTGAVRPLAFVKDGRPTLVLLNTNNAANTVDVSGLAPGVYARSQTTGGVSQELGLVTVPGAGTLTISLPTSATFTLYPHPGTNLPPNVTDWKATPPFLTAPSNATVLFASANDPETTAPSFNWSLLSAPAGTGIGFSASNSSNCIVSGLSNAGDYWFQLRISDGTNALTRQLPVTVYTSNQPPVVFDIHNRLPVTVILPTNGTTLRCATDDLENDPVTLQWSVVSQPLGAAASLLAPTTTSCPATNMDLPGDYVFRIVGSDPTHAVTNELTVTIYASNRPPVIVTTNASPASLTLPASSTTLGGITSDPDGDVLSHWWSVSNAPAGAWPVIVSPGTTNTAVSGLIVPGTYTFRLLVVDRAGATARGINVNVAAGASGPLVFVASPNGGETYSAMQTVNLRWSTYLVTNNVKLEFFDGTSWQTISASTTNDGVEAWPLPYGNFTGCKARVSDATNAAVFAETPGTFTITADTPRVLSFSHAPSQFTVEFDQQPGVQNILQRSFAFGSPTVWSNIVIFSNAAQTILWSDPGASNAAAAYYRVRTQ